MKTLYKNIAYIGLLALCLVGVYACSEDETYDFPGDSYNRVYIQDRYADYKIIRTPISSISNVDFETLLKCTQKANEDIKATIEIDNSMIEAFNNENGTNYEAMPASAILMKNPVLTIPAGTMATIDTLSLKLTNDQATLASLKNENGYLIPLRIATTKGGSAQASTNLYTTYLTITVTEDNVNHDAIESDITGTLVADQSGWSATTNGSIYSWGSPINAIFDGDKSTCCYISNSEDIHLDINMGRKYTFDAFTFYYSYWGDSEYSSLTDGMTVYTSDDGVNWKSAGGITSSSKFCVFYAPITAQYIRLISPKSSYGATIVGSVFNIYEK
ncbi:MAG: DUF1735 domain-containing protein [Bacteroides sp.]|jgi:hypothetical protein|nr:DUF1735 domain-containing protein [Bacteroides sp.]MCI1681887.1 DUF1735 domain-containing protein [Bacteroides sp.]